MIDSNFKNAKILVVDDQQANVDILHDFFEMQGYEHIKTTNDPRNVVQIFEDFEPDIILLDLSMPYLSGFEVMDQLKLIVPTAAYLPILVLTADVSRDAKRKALTSGASDFLTKPFDLYELQARVNTHLLIKFKNEQINNYAEELEKLIATKDKFFSIIAHDIRNPFVGIENFVKVLLKVGNYDINEVENNLQSIYSTAHQGHELLENLLKWSKSQTGKIEINLDMFQLTYIVNNCYLFIKAQAKDKNITLINNVSEEIIVETDKDMLETILRNLLSNAVKFTPAFGTISVNATIIDDVVEITITDTGIGISDTDKSKLFRIDSKLQSRNGTSQETGSGLGLILCKEFVDLLQGKMSVESEEGKGTTFKITIPTNM
ncbi:MAG: hybrid sensor histidine kinase/response regulator [Paludibacter sp.]